MAKIVIENVSFSYKDNFKSNEVFNDFNLEIKDGQFVCIIGKSGSGKSTLLSLIGGLKKPSKGKILIDDKIITKPGTDRAIVFQNYSLFPWMTAIENISFGIIQAKRARNEKEADFIAEKYLKQVDMLKDRDKYPYQLSGGMKQRIAIARAFAMNSEIFLLDEPFGALDAKNRQSLQKTIENLWLDGGEKRKTIVFITHEIEEAIILSDRIIVLNSGEVIEDIDIESPRPRNPMDFENLKYGLLKLLFKGEKDNENNKT